MRKLFPILFTVFIISASSTLSFAQNYGAKSIFKKYKDAVVVKYASDANCF